MDENRLQPSTTNARRTSRRRFLDAAAAGLAVVAAGRVLPRTAAADRLKESEMAYDNEASVRQAYYAAEGSVLDLAGFVSLFAEDGVINLGHAGQEYGGVGRLTYQGDQRGQLLLDLAKLYPDVHRELRRVSGLGDIVVVELSVQGTLQAPLTTTTGTVLPAGTKVDIPDADVWYLSDGKVERFDCYIVLGDISVLN